jgi:hypothetical protein
MLPFPFALFTKEKKGSQGSEKPPHAERSPEGSQARKASFQEKPSKVIPAPEVEKKAESASRPEDVEPQKLCAPLRKASRPLQACRSSEAEAEKEGAAQ